MIQPTKNAHSGLAIRKVQSGQALLEYALAIFLTVGMFMIIDTQIKQNIGRIWRLMGRGIAPGCPGCTPPEQIR